MFTDDGSSNLKGKETKVILKLYLGFFWPSLQQRNQNIRMHDLLRNSFPREKNFHRKIFRESNLKEYFAEEIFVNAGHNEIFKK